MKTKALAVFTLETAWFLVTQGFFEASSLIHRWHRHEGTIELMD